MEVKAFPVTSSAEPSNKLITEYNLINIINRLTDNDSFVVDYNVIPNADTPTSKNIIFNIHGYYFELTLNSGDIGFEEGSDLYAGISIYRQNNDDHVYDIIDLTYGNYQNKGLILSNLPISEENNTYSLQLLANGQVPPSSRIKFTTNSTSRSISIDDGDLD